MSEYDDVRELSTALAESQQMQIEAESKAVSALSQVKLLEEKINELESTITKLQAHETNLASAISDGLHINRTTMPVDHG